MAGVFTFSDLIPARLADLAGAALGGRGRRRSQLWRLYELSGDLQAGADFNTAADKPAGDGQLPDHGVRRPLFMRVLLPSFVLGAAGAALTAAGHPTAAAAVILVSAGAVAAAAIRKTAANSREAALFLADYPTTLMAMASSMKAGLTPLMALERAVKLLDADNELRREVQRMTGALRRGVPRETAVNHFAERITAPELELFRSAFLLVLANGGRFTPTLERLALVSRERCSLIQSAGVSTQSMRMTANILLVVAPLLVAIVSLGSADYWQILSEHPAAKMLAAGGAAMIAAGYLALRGMSNFKP